MMMKASELKPLSELAQVPNPEEEEEEKEKEEKAVLLPFPKKDILVLDGPALILRRPSSSSATVVESDSCQDPPESEILIAPPINPQEYSSPSSSASSNRDDDRNSRPNEDGTPVQPLQDQGGIPRRILVTTPKLEEVKLAFSGGEIDVDQEDGMKTPTSPASKISPILSCPPAPRKPASRPIHTKRKLAARRVLFQDYSDEIQALFSPNIASDSAAGKIKKVRLPRP
ncbi:unnamed protein product [Linum trigynum]|uniref:Uncharacterized protein n=1 Tax=Linum trigynum TaxID=586398 RepID=A0AAV2FS22_9ROSI